MQLVSPSEYIRIVGSALLVQRSPLALGMPFRASGFFRQLLEMQLVCRISPLVNFHPASEYDPKAAGSRTITPTCAPKHLSPDGQSNRSSSAYLVKSESTRKRQAQIACGSSPARFELGTFSPSGLVPKHRPGRGTGFQQMLPVRCGENAAS
jgi:hypothetical protein